MLNKLESFRSSLDENQRSAIEDVLPEDLIEEFFSANDEVSADKLIKKINKYLRIKPMIAFGLFKTLKPDQRKLIADLIDDEE